MLYRKTTRDFPQCDGQFDEFECLSVKEVLFCVCLFSNSLPNNKFLDWSKLKAFADNKINVTEKLKLALGQEENIVGKGENAGYQHFLLFPQMFSKAFIFKVVKSRDSVVKSQWNGLISQNWQKNEHWNVCLEPGYLFFVGCSYKFRK